MKYARILVVPLQTLAAMIGHRGAFGILMSCAAAVTPFYLEGCSFGPTVLKADQVDYSRALGDASKRQILSTIVGLRYADTPGFLEVTQIIAAYTFDWNTSAQVNAQPDPGGPRAGASGMFSYSNHPTFTFTPTTGARYAKTYMHPLSIAQILPLAESGVPIDLLIRIAVQSLGGYSNASMLGGETGNGAPEFFELLATLRRLQLAGVFAVRFKGDAGEGIVMTLNTSAGLSPSAGLAPSIADDLQRIRSLLHLAPDANEIRVVTMPTFDLGHEIVLISRSLLEILSDLSAEIQVPAEDIASGATQPAIHLVGSERRPVLIIHSERSRHAAYASIRYRARDFWIDDDDFDSKYALTVLQSLEAVAQATESSPLPVVTVPAR